jgi:MFS family permease
MTGDKMTKRTVAIVSAGFFTLFIAFAIRYSYGLVLPYMLSTLAISKTEAGVIFSSYFITATLLSPLMGALGDRVDAKILLATFVAILGAGSCLMSLSSSVVQASIFFAIIGIGHSACWAPLVAVLMRWISPNRRGIVISIVDLGTTAGIGVWSVLVPMIVGGHDWRMVWACLGVTAFAVAVLNFLFIKSRPDTPLLEQGREEPRERKVTVRESYRAILGDRIFHLIAFSYLFISFSILIPFTFLVSYATQKLAVSYASATGLLLVIAVAGTIGKPILAHVSDRVGRIEIMMLCGLLAACGALGMAFVREFAGLCVFSAIFGVGYGTLWAVYAASARDLFPGEYSGSIVGLWTVFHGIGSIIAPILAGRMIDASGAYQGAFVLAAAASLLSLVLLLPVRRFARIRKMSAKAA